MTVPNDIQVMNIVDIYKKRKNLSCIKKVIAAGVLLLWICFIWHNSMEVSDISGMRSIRITEAVNGILWNGKTVITEHGIRKLAHFFEYAVEGILTVFAFRAFKLSCLKDLGAGLLLGVMTALIDETIQLFSAGRDGAVGDVWIDFGGFVLGFLISALWVYCISKKNSI